jgi:hypothetical protein
MGGTLKRLSTLKKLKHFGGLKRPGKLVAPLFTTLILLDDPTFSVNPIHTLKNSVNPIHTKSGLRE